MKVKVDLQKVVTEQIKITTSKFIKVFINLITTGTHITIGGSGGIPSVDISVNLSVEFKGENKTWSSVHKQIKTFKKKIYVQKQKKNNKNYQLNKY